MSLVSEFLTIDSNVNDGVDVELEVKRSRFLTRLRRVTSEETARAVIDERRSRFFDARHHCSAFVLGPEGRAARSSDDGEPVVTRYFGGIKLGAGGLVRAYSEAVAHAVAAVGTRRVELCTLLRIDADFANIGTLENSLRGAVLPSGVNVTVEGVDWGDRARITVAVPVTATGEFNAFLSALSAGSLTAHPTGQRWVDRLG